MNIFLVVSRKELTIINTANDSKITLECFFRDGSSISFIDWMSGMYRLRMSIKM